MASRTRMGLVISESPMIYYDHQEKIVYHKNASRTSVQSSLIHLMCLERNQGLAPKHRGYYYE